MLKQSKIYLTEPRGYTDKLNLHRQGNNHKHQKKHKTKLINKTNNTEKITGN